MTSGGLAGRLRTIPPFDVLRAEVVTEVAAASAPRALADGEHLVETGDTATQLYVVLAGRFAVLAAPGDATEDALSELGPGSIVGEIAVLTGGTRSATLRAVGDAEVAAIDGERFVTLLDHQPELGATLARTASDRLLATRLRRHLAALFPATDVASLAETIDRTDIVTLAPGEVLFEEGDPADAAYVVISGRVRVLRRDADGGYSQPIAEVGAGELTGERALLDGQQRAATIVAARRTQLARLPRVAFEELALTDPRTVLTVTRTLVERQRDARTDFQRANQGRASVAFVPLHAGVDLDGITAAVTAEVAAMTTARRVTADALDEAVGLSGAAQAEPGGATELRVDRWLDELEAEIDLVVLQADPGPTAWTRRCLDRADHVVLVADATADPAPTDAERSLLPARQLPHQRVTLLLQHAAGTDRPRGTLAWLAERDVDDHLHLRAGHAGDIGRLARTLSGQAVWLVLGGGGAKGFAHLGLIRAMTEVGLPIDGLAGSSVGAGLAALVAMEIPAEELPGRTEELFHKVLDYTAPVSGLIAGERIARAIERGVGDRDISDTWLPYRCVSTNLTRSTTVVHRRGDLQRAMRASLSIPGVMPAVAFGEDLHVDGGVMNNLPVDVARRETPTGTVISSDVAPVLGPRAKEDHGLYVHGGGVLARRWLPGVRAPKVPRLMPTLMRSLLVAAAQTRDRGVEQGLADLHVQFELRGVGLLAFDVVGPVADRGYEESVDALRTFEASWRTEKVRRT